MTNETTKRKQGEAEIALELFTAAENLEVAENNTRIAREALRRELDLLTKSAY